MADNDDKIYNFGLIALDETASNDWRPVSDKRLIPGHKRVLILPGSATQTILDAVKMCKTARRMLVKENIKDVDICSLYFKQKTTFREGATMRAMYLLDECIYPLISRKNEEGDLEKISPKQAARNMRDLVIFTHCYGTYMLEAMDMALAKKLQELGYTEEEQKNIQKQLFVVHHNSLSNLLGTVKMHSTNLHRLTQADEFRKFSRFNSDGFQYYSQKEMLTDDETLYVRVGENERVLLVKQITQEGKNEHNGAYWHNDPKSKGGETERKLFEAIFCEAVRSTYPLDNIEGLIRQAVRQHPELKEDFNDALTYGKEFGDDYKEYHDNIVTQAKAVFEKQENNKLQEKEVKTLTPEILLYVDENDKMLLDYAVEDDNIPQAKILWNAVRKILPKQEAVVDDRFDDLSHNYQQAYESHEYYLQRLLMESRPEMFAALAKGADNLQRLDYDEADDKTLLAVAKIYAGFPAKTGQLDRLSYYKALIYMHKRIEQMAQDEKTAEVKKQLEDKIFTKANAKDTAVKYKVKSYAARLDDEALLKKCQQVWNNCTIPSLYQSNAELDKQ